MPNMKEGDTLPAIEKSVTQEQIESYAEAAGDFNPIHLDHEFAANTDFGGRIAHGMMIIAFISEMMTAAFQEDWLAKGQLKVRFRAPVYPGETVVTFGQVKSVQEQDGNTRFVCSVGVRKQNGDDAINGDATVIVPMA